MGNKPSGLYGAANLYTNKIEVFDGDNNDYHVGTICRDYCPRMSPASMPDYIGLQRIFGPNRASYYSTVPGTDKRCEFMNETVKASCPKTVGVVLTNDSTKPKKSSPLYTILVVLIGILIIAMLLKQIN